MAQVLIQKFWKGVWLVIIACSILDGSELVSRSQTLYLTAMLRNKGSGDLPILDPFFRNVVFTQ